jgi:hypothetical protein
MQQLGASGTDKVGGIVEAEAVKSAYGLLEATGAAGMTEAAELLSAAIKRCAVAPPQLGEAPAKPNFPQPERILDPETGRPIGLWR